MSEDRSLSIPINFKTIGTLLTIAGIAVTIIGTWYVNKEKINNLEKTVSSMQTSIDTGIENAKQELTSTISRVEIESKERDQEMATQNKENIANIKEKMEQIESVVHSTQLAVGTISQDIKNVDENISEIKEDLKTIRNNVRRRDR